MTNTDWVILQDDIEGVVLRCNRCDEFEYLHPLGGPAVDELPDLIATVNGFVEKHKECNASDQPPQ